jgi:hypothetical protein
VTAPFNPQLRNSNVSILVPEMREEERLQGYAGNRAGIRAKPMTTSIAGSHRTGGTPHRVHNNVVEYIEQTNVIASGCYRMGLTILALYAVQLMLPDGVLA